MEIWKNSRYHLGIRNSRGVLDNAVMDKRIEWREINIRSFQEVIVDLIDCSKNMLQTQFDTLTGLTSIFQDVNRHSAEYIR